MMRKDGKTPLYLTCLVRKLETNIMLLEFKSMHRLRDKGFDDLLGIVSDGGGVRIFHQVRLTH